MVDRLKRSIEDLEPPTCVHCHVEMKWYRSDMISSSPIVINHHFACPTCNRISERRSEAAAEPKIPPGKLSAPRWTRTAA